MGTAVLRLPARAVALGQLRRILGGLRKAPRLATALVFLAVFVAITADFITPHDPTDADVRARHAPPAFVEGGSTKYLLGTDQIGRDLLSRVIMGTRVSLSVSAGAIPLGALVGSMLGLMAGYRGGLIEALIMRVTDAMLAFPTILIALILAITMGPSFWVVVAVLALMVWPRYTRLVRGEVLSLKERDFVALARVAGCSSSRIILRHILPNIVNTVVVLSTLQVGWAIIVEASLSFLGAGIPPPTPSWGSMIADGRNYIATAWWVSVFPGIAIMTVVLSFNLFGDWLRDVLDPKLRQL